MSKYGNKRIFRYSIGITISEKISKTLIRDGGGKLVDLLMKKPSNSQKTIRRELKNIGKKNYLVNA